jgi:hypothetical protein
MHFRFADAIRSTLIRLFDAYMEATGENASSTGERFVGDKSFYSRLPFNRPSVKTADRIIQRMSDTWPGSIPWPSDIPRPPVGKWDDLITEIERPGGKQRRQAVG